MKNNVFTIQNDTALSDHQKDTVVPGSDKIFEMETINSFKETVFRGKKNEVILFHSHTINTRSIEAAIRLINSYVIDTYVCVKKVDDTQILVGYIVANENFVNTNVLTIKLKAYFPEYMIPTHFVIMDAISLLPNGRIDVEQLQEPNLTDDVITLQYPKTKLEKEVAQVWKRLLKIDEVDVSTSFFELGGHSLLVHQFIIALRKQKKVELPIRDFYASPTIRGISKLIPHLEKALGGIVAVPDSEYYPLSYSQEVYWDQLDTIDNHLYYASKAVKLNGRIDIEVLKQTFNKLIERHEILRTVFVAVDGHPFQKVLPSYELNIATRDHSGLQEELKEKQIHSSLEHIKNSTFEVGKVPLIKVELLKFSDEEFVIVLCQHYFIADRWNQNILLRDFIDVYNDIKKDPEVSLPQPAISFKDYAYWEKDNLKQTLLDEKLHFWEDKLDGHISELSLPFDYARPKVSKKVNETIDHVFSLEFSEKLRQFSEVQDTSLFMTMLTAFKLLLHKYSNQTDVCVGTVIANREYKEFEHVLGITANTIPLRTLLDKNQNLQEALENVKNTCKEAYIYADVPFGKIVNKLYPKERLHPQVLFRYMFNFIDIPTRNASLLDAEIEMINGNNTCSNFDINVNINTVHEQVDFYTINPIDRKIGIEWEYNSEIFTSDTMQIMLSTYIKILSTLITKPNQSLDAVLIS